MIQSNKCKLFGHLPSEHRMKYGVHCLSLCAICHYHIVNTSTVSKDWVIDSHLANIIIKNKMEEYHRL